MSHLRVIEFLKDEVSFKVDTQTSAAFLNSIESPAVGVRAYEQHHICASNLLNHPSGESLGWTSFELINPAINAVRTKPLREFEHHRRMLMRVVAVANEHCWYPAGCLANGRPKGHWRRRLAVSRSGIAEYALDDTERGRLRSCDVPLSP